jgi:hypothetical protein
MRFSSAVRLAVKNALVPSEELSSKITTSVFG